MARASSASSHHALKSVSALGVLGFLIGCSFTRAEDYPCERHAQCRAVFGFGTTCNPAGYCEPVPANPRCTLSVPQDLLTRPEQHRNDIVLGCVLDFSSPTHQVRDKIIRLAMKEARQVGELDNQALGMVLCDYRENPEWDDLTRVDAAVASARYLGDTLGIPAIIGPWTSPDVQKVWEETRSAGTLIMTPTATSPKLTTLEPAPTDEHPGQLWRSATPDSVQGAAIAQDILARNVTDVYVIRESGAYGEELAEVFRRNFEAAGGRTEIQGISAETEIGTASALFAESEAPEVLFIASQIAWTIRFLNAAGGQPAYVNKRIFLTDAAASDVVYNSVGSEAAALFPKIRGTRPAARDPLDYPLASFIANYRAEYNGEDPLGVGYSPHTYDAAWLVVYGVTWSVLQGHSASSLGIAQGLRKVSSGTPQIIVPSSWPKVIDAFRAGEPVNVSGASGELDYDPTTEELLSPIEIWEVQTVNGRHRVVKVETRQPSPQFK